MSNTNLKLSVYIFFVTTLGFFTNSFADQKVIYINGIQNTWIDAETTRRKIKSLLDTSSNHTFNKLTYKVGLQWNPIGFDGTNGKVTLPSRDKDFQEDLDELFQSKLLEETYSRFYDGIYAPHDENNPTLDKIKASNLFDFSSLELPSFKKPVLDASNNISSLSDSVIVVAHSQGNLIANYVWSNTVQKYGSDAFNKLRVVNVANTTLYSPNKLNITHAGDGAIFNGQGDLGCSDDSLENLPFVKGRSRATPNCQNEICSFEVSSATFDSSQHSFDSTDVVDNCLHHGMVETYLSERLVTSSVNQNVTFGSGTRFRDRLEDFIYTATESLEKANDVSKVNITGKFKSPITIGEVPNYIGNITSEQKISSLRVNYTPPPDGGFFDGSTYTLLDCPDETFGDCSRFEANNSGVVDLAFITFAKHRFSEIGEYPITIDAENIFGKKGSKDFVVTVIPKVESVSVSPNPVEVGKKFKVSVSGKKLSSDVKAYVVGGSECSVATPTNNVFVEFDCTANKEGDLTYVVYYKERATELNKGLIKAETAELFCTPDSTDTPASCEITNGLGEKTRQCLADGSAWGEYGDCQVQNCTDGFHISGNVCTEDTPDQICTPETTENRTCSIANGEGTETRTCSADGSTWGEYESCLVSSCDTGYRIEGNICEEDTSNQVCTPDSKQFQDCSIENGKGSHSRTCESDGLSWSKYSSCTIQSCNTGYHIEGNGCVIDTPTQVCTPSATESQSCSIANGLGSQIRTCSADGLSWGVYESCSVHSCNTGYHIEGNGCVIDTPTQVCTPNSTDSQTCPITNGSGSQGRTCAADGLSWGNYGFCIVTNCNAGYVQSGNGCIPESAEIGIPTNLIVKVTGTVITVGWLPVDNADEYRIRLVDEDGNDDRYINTEENALNIFNFTRGHRYKLKVKAKVNDEYGDYSEYKSFTIEEIPIPTNLKAEDKSANTVHLSWSLFSEADEYQVILERISGGTWTRNVTGFLTFTDLAFGQDYKFKVSVKIGEGYGEFSSYENFTVYCPLNKFSSKLMYEELTFGDRDTNKGGSKTQVKELQEFLIYLGYDVGSSGTDGIFGHDTQSAVEAYQEDKGIETTGSANNLTNAYINTTCN